MEVTTRTTIAACERMTRCLNCLGIYLLREMTAYGCGESLTKHLEMASASTSSSSDSAHATRSCSTACRLGTHINICITACGL